MENKNPYSLKSFLYRLVYIAVAGGLCALDQFSKAHMRAFLESRPGRQLTVIAGYFDLVYRYNTGGAFSMGEKNPTFFLYFPVLLIIVLVVMLVWFTGQKGKNTLTAIAITLMISGAAGNLVDRFRDGRVFDFIEWHFRTRAYWPAFNVADTYISLGVALFAITMLLAEKKEKDSGKSQ